MVYLMPPKVARGSGVTVFEAGLFASTVWVVFLSSS